MANNYPEWWNQTITVFNRFEDPSTRLITWYSTVITNCFWKYTGDKVTIDKTTLETDNIICRIPVNANFLEKYQWDALSVKTGKFTFGPGDIIVKGAVSDTISEYTSGQHSSDLLTKYRKLQGCMQIEKCAINVGAGRGNEHYYVKGV